MSKNEKLMELILLMAEYHKEDLSPARKLMFCEDLKVYDIDAIKKSWAAFRMDPKNKGMPTPAQIVDNFQDGRPSDQEAWAQIPKDESGSVVWSEEMRLAFGDAYPLLSNGNPSGAFFVFRDSYNRRVRFARHSNKKPRWSLTFGTNHASRAGALKQAVEKGIIDMSEAKLMLPEAFSDSELQQIPEKIKNLIPEKKALL